MTDYYVSPVGFSDAETVSKVKKLLEKEGIELDRNLDYIAAIFDSDSNVIATGSAFRNMLRCFAVDSAHRGEGLLNLIVTHLAEVQADRGNSHLFIYSKAIYSSFFEKLGFHEIARVDDSFVFMENCKDGFSSYIDALARTRFEEGISGAVVMNANPFTKGHQYLLEKACSECDHLHLFIVSEDLSIIPYSVRYSLVKEAIKNLDKIIIHDTGSYIISSATFPSYFLKDEISVAQAQARLDAIVFTKIAKALNITVRFVGNEPLSAVTSIYNDVLRSQLPKEGISFRIIPRLKVNGVPISASNVRKAIKEDDWATVKALLPSSSYDFFRSSDAAPIIRRIKESQQ
ncbi:MAG: [citrate (pro-3S)-lyase] ligase [Sphaerochaetaceae bacterium]|nr:[citrate (pro-3S)-lyase] ligase [Candidatus Cloacimonadota bacterium]MDD2232035.1 [citrate (pro-3S)-lyase] ligase [Sphaerochaetaceae bacterium]